MKPSKMIIKPVGIKVADVFDQFKQDNGVYGYHGQLEIRPKYQRDFIYDLDRQKAVIHTILHGYPLNTMYWAKSYNDKTGQPILDSKGRQMYELLDGQQRIRSICNYLSDDFSYKGMFAHNLRDSEPDKLQQIMDYELDIYICDGSTSEKLAWFRTLNTAGIPLTEQELLNAQYTGPWLTKAKEYFSQADEAPQITVIPNHMVKDYIHFGKGDGIDRQGLLHLALAWIKDYQGLPASTLDGDDYMSQHQSDDNDDELESYFNQVFDWVGSKFKSYYKQERGLPWGIYYNNYERGKYKGQLIDKDSATIDKEIQRLMADDEVTSKSGIFKYILTGEEKRLSLRTFRLADKETMYNKQRGHCPLCDKNADNHTYPEGQSSKKFGPNTYELSDMEADHIVPWDKGGKTVLSNCQMLCKWHNKDKSDLQ